MAATDLSPTAVWERINQFYQSTRKPVHVAVAYTADAAAASLTLIGLLKAFLINYNIHPIATYDELGEVIARANMAQDFARMSEDEPFVDELFLLVGLGAPVDLGSLFDLSQRHVVIVLDSTRPFHLANIRAEDSARLVLWGSARIHEEVAGFFQRQREEDAVARRRRRRQKAAKRIQKMRREYADGDAEGNNSSSSSSSDDDEDDSDVSGADDEASDDGEEAISQSQDRIDWMNAEDVPPFLESLYYASACAGRSCAVEAHELAVLLNRFKETTLWHAAVGVCDLFRRRLIDYGSYLVAMRPLQDAVTLQRSVRHGVLEEITDGEANKYRRLSTNVMHLSNREEEQLHLLRHATLWDAVWFHPVTASVLGLHHVEDGEGFLRQLFARCGVSVKVARQPWREVPMEDKTEALRLVQAELKHIIERKGSFIAFPNAIGCISRTMGYSADVSTFDACVLFEALIAAAPPPSLYHMDAASMDAATAAATLQRRLQDTHRAQFWKAHAILDVDPSEKSFAAAVEESLSLQMAIASATSALMQPGMLQSTAGIHYTLPNDPTKTTTAMESFCTLYRLETLANRLLLTLTVERGLGRYTRRVRPLLLSCAMPKATLSDNLATGGFTATTTTSGTGASSSSAQGGGAAIAAAMAEPTSFLANGNDDVQYLVVLAQEGAKGPGLVPLPELGRMLDAIQDKDEFQQSALPSQRYTQRNCVVVEGRAQTIHLNEVMYLKCLSTRWDPKKEYMMRIAEEQMYHQDDTQVV